MVSRCSLSLKNSSWNDGLAEMNGSSFSPAAMARTILFTSLSLIEIPKPSNVLVTMTRFAPLRRWAKLFCGEQPQTESKKSIAASVFTGKHFSFKGAFVEAYSRNIRAVRIAAERTRPKPLSPARAGERRNASGRHPWVDAQSEEKMKRASTQG